MNIFVLDTNPHLAAEAICDQHLNKMILESTQMICTALHTLLPGRWNGNLYKPVQPNHPCNKWLIESKANIDWLYSHAITLNNERKWRFPSRVEHGCLPVLEEAIEILDNEFPDDQQQTPFVYVGTYVAYTPTTPERVVQAYREYYRDKSIGWSDAGKRPMVWTLRSTPKWMYP